MSNASPTPAVAASLEIWKSMVLNHDLGRLSEITHPEAVFKSPAAHTPYHSAQALSLALNTVIQVFKDFEYHRTLYTEDGQSVVFEFSANVGDKAVKGIDLIKFDENGKIIEFEVMIRPLSGLQALAQEMGARIGAQLPNYKPTA